MKIMLEDKFNQEILKLLERDDVKNIHEMIIGEDLDSLDILNIISFYEEKFNITLDSDDIIGKKLADLYNLIE